MTLNQPSPSEFFSNNQAKLDCVITGRDEKTINEIQITWQIDGKTVTSTTEPPKSEGNQYTKTSTMIFNSAEWETVNAVSCSAVREDVTLITQELTVQRGGMLLSDGDLLVQL